ncbi:hypothetical protein [Caballeronia sp. dw_276]|uniref:terminase small subunit-like protein n=1 Tax=Caballeronia sp. dw_276 TaxID=2719795 RepID=UPI001BD58D3F|nr:hypothetical protein [Caballeronia sp. dw_276]
MNVIGNRSAGRRFFPAIVFEMIVARSMQTGKTVEEICDADISLPSAATVYNAIKADAELAQRYAEAMQARRAGQSMEAV